MKDNAYTGRI